MKAEYDKETDTLTITLRDARVKESDEIRPGVIADFGYDGGVVGFNYQSTNLTGTDSTQLLVVQTNATNYMAGLLSIQDRQSANGLGFQPVAATPEPVSMTLLGGGLALLGAVRLRKKNKKSI